MANFKFLNNPLYRNSLIIFVSGFIAAIFNYLFNPIMGRLLGPVYYGELVSLLALFMFFSVPTGALTTVAAKYASIFLKDPQKNYHLFYLFLKKSFLLTIPLVIIYLAITPFLKDFFKLSGYYSLLAVALFFGTSFSPALSRGILQGLKKFKTISFFNILEPILKIVFSVGIFYLGFKVGGVIVGVAVGTFLAWIGIFKLIKLSKKPVDLGLNLREEVVKYSGLVFINSLLICFFFNLDVLAVKHYFSPEIAGQFGAISLLGKAIVFIGGALTFVFFPLASEMHEQKNSALPLLKKALAAMGIFSLISVLVYYLADYWILRILFGVEYLALSNILWLSAIVFGLYSLITILTTYYLAIRQKTFLYYLLGGLILLLVLLFFWHSSLVVIMQIFIFVFLLVFACLFLLLYGKNCKKT